MRPFLWNEDVEGGIEAVEFTVANLHGHFCILVNGRVMSESEARQMVDVLNNYCQMMPLSSVSDKEPASNSHGTTPDPNKR